LVAKTFLQVNLTSEREKQVLKHVNRINLEVSPQCIIICYIITKMNDWKKCPAYLSP
jgi:hypothetical protein